MSTTIKAVVESTTTTAAVEAAAKTEVATAAAAAATEPKAPAVVYDAESAIRNYLSARDTWVGAKEAAFFNWLGRLKPGAARSYKISYTNDQARLIELVFGNIQKVLHAQDITLVRTQGAAVSPNNVVLFSVDRVSESSDDDLESDVDATAPVSTEVVTTVAA